MPLSMSGNIGKSHISFLRDIIISDCTTTGIFIMGSQKSLSGKFLPTTIAIRACVSNKYIIYLLFQLHAGHYDAIRYDAMWCDVMRQTWCEMRRLYNTLIFCSLLIYHISFLFDFARSLFYLTIQFISFRSWHISIIFDFNKMISFHIHSNIQYKSY